jgi:anti-sigma-K factor RskA
MSESCFTSEIYALYVIGSLDGEDFGKFDRHLRRGCEACRTELAQARELWTRFGAAAPAIDPRPELKARILSAALRSMPVAMPPRRPALTPWWQQAAAAVVLLGIGLAAGWNLRRPAAVSHVTEPAPPAPVTAPGMEQAEQENRTLRARMGELAKALGAQEAQLRESAARSKDASELERTIARLQTEATASAQAVQQAQARIAQTEARNQQLLGQASAAEARAKDADQRYQTAENERKLALDRESRQRETAAARIRQLEGENEKFRRVIDDQQRRIQQNTQLAAFFASPDLKFYRYTGTGNGPSAKAHVVMQSGSKAVFYAFHLPKLPAGRTYQLWLIRGQNPAIVSGGIFQADPDGNAVVQFSDAGMLRDVRQFAVTDEPSGGSPGPTGKQFLRAAS